MRRADISGQRFHQLTVEGLSHIHKGHTYWACRCDCGGSTTVSLSNLKSGSIKACGCKTPTTANLIGTKVGKLTVVAQVGKRGHKSLWKLACDCGGTKTLPSSEISRARANISCGCDLKERKAALATKHGGSGSPTHRTWSAMLTRVRNPGATDFHLYGGRGIVVCDRWLKYENFLEDMGERPPGTSIDRLDPNRGYEKENCRWATPSEQAINRRSTILVRFEGEIMSVTAYARRLGVSWRAAKKLANKHGLTLTKEENL